MGKTNPPSVSVVREKMRRAVEFTGMTQEEIGLRMGPLAKDSVSLQTRFVDPFVDAIGPQMSIEADVSPVREARIRSGMGHRVEERISNRGRVRDGCC